MKAKNVAKHISALAIAVIVASFLTNTAYASSYVFHMSVNIDNWRGEVAEDEADAEVIGEPSNTVEPLMEIVPTESAPEDDVDLPEDEVIQDETTTIDEILIPEDDIDEPDHIADTVDEVNEVNTAAPDNAENAGKAQDKTPALTEPIDETERKYEIIEIGDEEDDDVDTYTLESEE